MVRSGWVLLLYRFDMIFVYFLKVKLAGFTRVLVIRCRIKKRGKADSKAFGLNNSTTTAKTTLPFTETVKPIGGTGFGLGYQQLCIGHVKFEMPVSADVQLAFKYTNLQFR